MKDNIFREYDIRGIVDQELFIDKSYELGKAIATYYKNEHPTMTQIIVGRDARTHSPAISENIIKGITDLGFDVIDIGPTPTPVMYYAVHLLKTPSALTITASHNTKEYNGVKLWGAWGPKIQQIKNIYNAQEFYKNTSKTTGKVVEKDVTSSYIAFLANHFADLKGKELNVAIDCGNGSAGFVFPELVEKMEWKNVKLLYPEVDGTFPNHIADPTVPKNMTVLKETLTSDESLQWGLGLDGDCDRMNPMTKSGDLIPGDKLLAVYAKQALNNHPHATVVFDVKASSGLEELLNEWHAKPLMSPSGHSLIKEAMKKHKALIAGELSCHFFFNDRYFGYDDGIYAALRLFEIVEKTKQSLDELVSIFPKKVSSPEIRIPCKTDNEKVKIVDDVKTIFGARQDAKTLTIDGIRAQMDYGWGLVRASNTQPVICLRFESSTPDGLKQVKNDFYQALEGHFEEKTLKETFEL